MTLVCDDVWLTPLPGIGLPEVEIRFDARFGGQCVLPRFLIWCDNAWGVGMENHGP